MRKSSRGGQPTAPLAPAEVLRAPEFLGFEPTDMQLKTKAKLWAMYHENPLVSPEHMSAAEMARALDAPSLEAWWRDPNFRAWFLQKDGWRHELEFAFQVWLADAVSRLRSRSIADKDFIQFGKLIGELTARLGRHDTDKPKGRELSEKEAIQLFESLAPSLGYAKLPPKSGTSEGGDA